eukprot:74002-Rhodomonas_salina.1
MPAVWPKQTGGTWVPGYQLGYSLSYTPYTLISSLFIYTFAVIKRSLRVRVRPIPQYPGTRRAPGYPVGIPTRVPPGTPGTRVPGSTWRGRLCKKPHMTPTRHEFSDVHISVHMQRLVWRGMCGLCVWFSQLQVPTLRRPLIGLSTRYP